MAPSYAEASGLDADPLADDGDTGAGRPLPSEGADAVGAIDRIDLARADVTSVLWATGYRYDFGWVHAPVFDAGGRPQQRRGVTAQPGLYLLGLHWMHTFKSGLLSGVDADAEHLAEDLSAPQ